ncbi:hypothetical protein ACH5RR_015409 [Cinchona calisaya]|uniref:Zinc knuckle CX2CX4HX4C domain-containing protein n=1 Tax=Cinchona calisaya TaxID=153742 RepID=A0ABD2ZT21_9GENT
MYKVKMADIGNKKGKHIKPLVDIDITKPLSRGTCAKLNGFTKWINFKYEFCPYFCYIYGRIGHIDRNCADKGSVGAKEIEYQFENWMRANNSRTINLKRTFPMKKSSKVSSDRMNVENYHMESNYKGTSREGIKKGPSNAITSKPIIQGSDNQEDRKGKCSYSRIEKGLMGSEASESPRGNSKEFFMEIDLGGNISASRSTPVWKLKKFKKVPKNGEETSEGDIY